jgi:hypothetical protein
MRLRAPYLRRFLVYTATMDPQSVENPASHSRILASTTEVQQAPRAARANVAFDPWLKTRSPDTAIRDAEAVDALASSASLRLFADMAMSANRRSRVRYRVHD